MPERPLPEVINGFQARLIWTSTSAPRPATNTIVFRDSAGLQNETDLFNDLNANVTQSMWDLVGGTGTAITQVRVTKLDGASAGQLFLPTGVKWSAGSASDPILQGSAVVSLMTAQRGPSGRGRVYLPFIGEAGQAAGVLTPANVTIMQNAWTAFKTAMLAAGWIPIVVNYQTPPAVSPSHDVTQFVVRPNMKTQRRRARR